MPTVVFPGRFQPFHNAHWRILKGLMRRFKCVIVALGSSDRHDGDNPFSTRQRREMIEKVLRSGRNNCRRSRGKKLKRGGCNVVFAPLPHAPDSKWVSMLLSHVARKRFDAVFTNNPRVRRQLKLHGIPVLAGRMIDRRRLSGERLRRFLPGWERLVPQAAAGYIKRLSIPRGK